MERYLVAHGVPKEKIIKEQRSTSTEENLQFSKAMLTDILSEKYRTVLITNDFHVYRACRLAEQLGYANIAHVHAGTTWYMVIPNGIRECLAIAAYRLGL